MDTVSLYILCAREILYMHLYRMKIGMATYSSSSNIRCLECVLHVITVLSVGYFNGVILAVEGIWL